MLKYFPYKSDKKDKKYFIITDKGKRVYFGASGYDDYTTHNDEERRIAYVNRHRKNEDWKKTGLDTAGFWSYHYLWKYKTKKEAYRKIKEKYL